MDPPNQGLSDLYWTQGYPSNQAAQQQPYLSSNILPKTQTTSQNFYNGLGNAMHIPTPMPGGSSAMEYIDQHLVNQNNKFHPMANQAHHPRLPAQTNQEHQKPTSSAATQIANTGIILETNSGKRKRSYQHIADPAERRRVRNRESAKLARQNKKLYLTQLEMSQRKLYQENHALHVQNEDMVRKMKQLVDATGICEDEVVKIVGCRLEDLRRDDNVFLNQSSDLGTYQSDDGESSTDEQIKTAPVVKQEYKPSMHTRTENDGSITTFGMDAVGYTQINENRNSGYHGVRQNEPAVPAPAPLINGMPIGSPSSSSGYTSENQPRSPAECAAIAAAGASAGMLNPTAPPNIIGFTPYGYNQTQPFNPMLAFQQPATNMFNYDSNLIQSAAQNMVQNQVPKHISPGDRARIRSGHPHIEISPPGGGHHMPAVPPRHPGMDQAILLNGLNAAARKSRSPKNNEIL